MPTNAEMLTEAKAALHALATGTAVVEVRDSSGESVRYTRANLSSLRNYIADLEAKIAAGPDNKKTTRYPMRLQF